MDPAATSFGHVAGGHAPEGDDRLGEPVLGVADGRELVRPAEVLDPALDGHDEVLLAEWVVDGLQRRVGTDQGAVAALHQRPCLAGRLGGPTFDLGPKLVGRPSAGRVIEEVDGADPSFDAVLPEEVVEEEVRRLGPRQRSGPGQARVPQPDIHPLTTLVPAGDRAESGQIDLHPVQLQRAKQARLTARVVLPRRIRGRRGDQPGQGDGPQRRVAFRRDDQRVPGLDPLRQLPGESAVDVGDVRADLGHHRTRISGFDRRGDAVGGPGPPRPEPGDRVRGVLIRPLQEPHVLPPRPSRYATAAEADSTAAFASAAPCTIRSTAGSTSVRA